MFSRGYTDTIVGAVTTIDHHDACVLLAARLTLDRQRAGKLTHLGACSPIEAEETLLVYLADCEDYANGLGGFFRHDHNGV
jgi:hypothetical protein